MSTETHDTLLPQTTDSERTLLSKVLMAVANLNLLGIGSPEGVVSAPVGSRYTDLTDTEAPVHYFKATGNGNTGWI